MNIGDFVKVKAKTGTWEGSVLQSHDSDVVLLKLNTGYNIGVRNSEIKKVDIVRAREEKVTETEERGTVAGLRNVAMVITGGTISSKLDPVSGGVKWTGVDEIFKMAPSMAKICNITRIEKPFMKGSEDMGPKDWKRLAEVVHGLLLDTSIDGVIVTHGTDTLHYTAAALSFFLGDLNKPVALTYSQRSIDRASTDAALNLVCAARFAISDVAEVAVVGHKDLNDVACLALRGTKCRKMHTSRRDSFKAVNCEPLAKITMEHMEVFGSYNIRRNGLVTLDAKFSEKVALIKAYPGADPGILDYYLNAGYRGLIIEGTGLGHVPGKESSSNWLPKIKKMINLGIVIAIAPQTIYGSLNSNVYVTGRELQKTGVLFLGDMLSETAYVKLGWLLGHKGYSVKDVESKMLENISGELNSKLGFNDFV